MNLNDNGDFEERLRQFRPGPVPSGLETRIGQALEAGARASRRRRMGSTIAWGGIIVAASVLITFGVLLFNGRLNFASGGNPVPAAAAQSSANSNLPGTGQPADTFAPVLAENNLQNRVDEGIVFLRNGLTARRYRYEFLDRVVWKNPATGAVVEMEIPRDEVILVPVQTY